MDGVHLALLRALRRHLEMLSSGGSELASKSLRRLDWSLLDTLTWPVYLVEYLLVMGYAKGLEWKGFYTDILDGEYYSISVTRKLMILQILCDDVIESAELKAELDMRESLEEGSDFYGTSIPPPPPNGPRRVHPRYSKTSACKDLEAAVIVAKPCNSKSTYGASSDSKGPELDTDTTDLDQDGNSDECQLCGMDGTLLCCDGCPSAYHSRCIGLNKMLIPDGLWFCPECTANKMDPALRIATGLKGAEVFGIDSYEQIFLGICNHLLVLNASIGAETSSRYYNQDDIPKVLQVLCSSLEHKTLYSGICKSILQYWEILEGSNICLPERTDTEKPPSTYDKEDAKVSVSMHTLSGKGTDKALDAVEGENCASSVTVCNVENGMVSGGENDCQEAQLISNSLDTVNQNSQPSLQRNVDVSVAKVSPVTNTKLCEQFGTESMLSSGSINHYPDHSDLILQNLTERCAGSDSIICDVGNKDDTEKKHVDGMSLPTNNDALSVAFERAEGQSSGGGTSKGDKNGAFLYVGALFKPQSYINQYFLGDVAASAAANLAVLTSEEKGVSEVHASSNPRKIVSANIALQLKAFSSASIRFIWPNSEKKVMEVPRERCGWCLSCKAPTTSKKGCLLNLAASNAIKGSARIVVGLRSVKNGEGIIPGIATYILYMEESLRGLFVGPFLSSSYRKQWRKQVEKASTCSEIKFSLLELEEQIRLVAFSGDWFKLMNDWTVESSAMQISTCSVGPTPKRPGGRRNRKQAAISEVATNPCDDDFKIVRWWRGGKLSKLVFQKGILPCSIVKKAARQGGRKKISGIHYADGSEIPKRSRQYAWRAAVEMSKNAPQLALQVRYLDLHVRWSDMVRPDQNSHDGKGSEAEISAFRNGLICDKKTQENKITYGLTFSKQKHLPSRVMKNVIDVEHNDEDGEDKFWFSEIHVPLFLIKEYEQKAEKEPAPPAKTLQVLSKLQRRQLKASRRNIFLYLIHKEERVDKCSCAACQEDVLLGDAVKCNECEGYCHKDCTTLSTVDCKDEVDNVVICNQCYHAKAIALNENINTTTIGQFFPQGQDYKMVVAVTKDAWQNGYCQQLVSAGTTETHSLMKSYSAGPNLTTRGKRGTVASYGIIWKSKKTEDPGTNFRLSNILLRGNGDIDSSRRPQCYLCSKPYNPDLMYIRCEDCQCWYHADAIQLKESQIFDVVGFKCCKCRRKGSPICPYMDPESRRPRVRASKQGGMVMEPGSETISRPSIGWEPTTPASSEKMEEVVAMDEDELLFSLLKVEPISEATSEFGPEWDTAGTYQGPQKLPIRRHVKPERDVDSSFVTPREGFMPFEANTLMTAEIASPPQAEWEFPVDGIKDEMFDYENVNYEDMEFEPQTYFSFSELLATDDSQSGLFESSMDVPGNWGNNAGSVAPLYNLPEPYEMGTREDHPELRVKIEPAVNNVPCQMCRRTEPAPDLSCGTCGMCIHNHCSPWIEPTYGERWDCGRCREWR